MTAATEQAMYSGCPEIRLSLNCQPIPPAPSTPTAIATGNSATKTSIIDDEVSGRSAAVRANSKSRLAIPAAAKPSASKPGNGPIVSTNRPRTKHECRRDTETGRGKDHLQGFGGGSQQVQEKDAELLRNFDCGQDSRLSGRYQQQANRQNEHGTTDPVCRGGRINPTSGFVRVSIRVTPAPCADRPSAAEMSQQLPKSDHREHGQQRYPGRAELVARDPFVEVKAQAADSDQSDDGSAAEIVGTDLDRGAERAWRGRSFAIRRRGIGLGAQEAMDGSNRPQGDRSGADGDAGAEGGHQQQSPNQFVDASAERQHRPDRRPNYGIDPAGQ